MERVLNRTVWHDPRNWFFRAREGEVRDVFWTPGPILDQGSTGSCTGHALAGLLNIKQKDRQFNHEDALGFYALGTYFDPYQGVWPGDDTGSSGIAVAKGATKARVAQAYGHVFGIDHFLRALSVGPLLVGSEWYDGMFDPASDGTVAVHGNYVGGHEYVAIGYDTASEKVWFQNSWGQGWGDGGLFKMNKDDLAFLLGRQGDATQVL